MMSCTSGYGHPTILESGPLRLLRGTQSRRSAPSLDHLRQLSLSCQASKLAYRPIFLAFLVYLTPSNATRTCHLTLPWHARGYKSDDMICSQCTPLPHSRLDLLKFSPVLRLNRHLTCSKNVYGAYSCLRSSLLLVRGIPSLLLVRVYFPYLSLAIPRIEGPCHGTNGFTMRSRSGTRSRSLRSRETSISDYAANAGYTNLEDADSRIYPSSSPLYRDPIIPRCTTNQLIKSKSVMWFAWTAPSYGGTAHQHWELAPRKGTCTYRRRKRFGFKEMRGILSDRTIIHSVTTSYPHCSYIACIWT